MNRYLKDTRNYHKTITEDSEKKYFSYVKGKKVAIVGPSPQMKGKHLGKEIDSHDIIIRLNHGHSLVKNDSIDFGSRTNIIYINQMLRKNYGTNLPQEWFTDDLKFISILFQHLDVLADIQLKKNGRLPLCPICNEDMKHDDIIEIISAMNKGGEPYQTLSHWKCYNKNVQFDQLPVPYVKTYLSEFNKYFGTEFILLLGVRAIFDIMKYQPSTVNVFGFDFYDEMKKKNASDVEFNDLYAEGYTVLNDSFTGSLKNGPETVKHKDTEGKQLNLLRNLYETLKETNKYSTAGTLQTSLNVDSNLKSIMYPEVSKEESKKQLQEKLKLLRQKRNRK